MRNPNDTLNSLGARGYNVKVVSRVGGKCVDGSEYHTYVATETPEPGDTLLAKIDWLKIDESQIMGINFALDEFSRTHIGGILGTIHNPDGVWSE